MEILLISIMILVLISILIKIRVDQKNVTPIELAKKQLKNGKTISAINTLEESIAVNNKQYEAYKLLADTYYQIKSYDEALEMYNLAIQNEAEPIAYFNRAITYVTLNQLELAINDVTYCLTHYTGDKNFIYKELGYLYQMKGDQLQSKFYYDMVMKTSA